MADVAVYIHWPYCVSKCPYCDFSSRAQRAGDESLIPAYEAEIAYYARQLPGARVTSIFFGGGTPSLMTGDAVRRIVMAVSAAWPLADDVEVTLEANPSSAEMAKFKTFRAAGVNRLSLGVQSFRDDVLRFLGRAHDGRAAIDALALAADIFPRFSFDLMYAYRDQTLADWEKDLSLAARYGARHISAYQLTIEPHTPFARRVRFGEALTAPPDVAEDLYDMTGAILTDAGLPPYEISNYAAPGQESRHNLTYWQYNDYIGIGPAAHGRVPLPGTADQEPQRFAVANHKNPQEWRAGVLARGHGAASREALTPRDAMIEAALMGLRLVRGIDSAAWQKKFGMAITDFMLPDAYEKLCADGLIENAGGFLRASDDGRRKLDSLLTYVLPN